MTKEIDAKIEDINSVFFYHVFHLSFEQSMQTKLTESRDSSKKTSRKLYVLTTRLRSVVNDQKIKSERAASRDVFKLTRDQSRKTQNYVRNKSKSKTDDIKLKRDKSQDRRLTDAERETLRKNKKCF